MEDSIEASDDDYVIPLTLERTSKMTECKDGHKSILVHRMEMMASLNII